MATVPAALSALPPVPYSADWYAGTQRRRGVALAIAAVLASLACAALVLALQFVSVAVLLTLAVLVGVACRPRVGLYVVFALVCLFEGASLDPLMLPGEYLNRDLSTSLHLPGVIFNPFELLLMLSLVVWAVQGLLRRTIDFRGGSLWWPMLGFFGALVFGLVRGMAGGGLFNYALWESRSLFYMVACYVLATNTVRTRRHVRTITAIFMVTTLLFAVEGAWRRLALIDSGLLGSLQETWYAHEDVVFLASLVLLALAQLAFGAARWLRVIGLLLIGLSGYTLLATDRRAGMIAFMVAFLAFSCVFFFANRKAFFLITVPVLLCTAIYMPLFWNASGTLAQPARAVRSLTDPDPRDASSNLSRELEKVNIIATIQSNPLLGVGFGQKYLQVVSMPDISWFSFWEYETHRNVVWLWLKTGALGLILFYALVGNALARAGHLVRTLHEPEARSFAMLAIAGIVTSIVFAYVDLGLTSARIPVLMGTLMGVLAVLERAYPRASERQAP